MIRMIVQCMTNFPDSMAQSFGGALPITPNLTQDFLFRNKTAGLFRQAKKDFDGLGWQMCGFTRASHPAEQGLNEKPL